MTRQEGRGPGRRGLQCACGGVLGVSRTLPATDGVVVRYRYCQRCGVTHKSVETLVDDFSPSVTRIARAILRLLNDERGKERLR